MEKKIQVIFSRCPVGTATEASIKHGWLQEALARKNAQFCLLQSMAPALHKAHYTQEPPLHFRDGGNIPPLWAQSQGDRSILLGVSYQKELRGIFVRPDSPIHSIEDLKGKRLAIPVRKDAVIDFRYLTMLHGFEGILKHIGLTLDDTELCFIPCSNVKPKQLIGNNMDTLNKDSDFLTEDVQAVLNGTADAAFANSIKAVRHNNAGLLRNILPWDLHNHIPNINNNAVLAITCTKPFAYQHPDLVVTYLKEVIKAGHWAAHHPDEFLECAASGIYGATPEEMDASFERETLLNRIPELTDKSFDMLNQQKEFMIRWGKIRKEDDFDVSSWADPTFLKEAIKLLQQ